MEDRNMKFPDIFLKKSALDCLYKFGRQRSVILPFIWNMEKEKDIVKKNSYKD